MQSKLEKQNNKYNLEWKILLAIWFLKFFSPEVLIAYYLPQLLFIRTIPTVLLLILFVKWVSSDVEKKQGYILLILFLLSFTISSIGAENLGRSSVVIRVIFEFYILSRLTFSYCNNYTKLLVLYRLFIISFIYLALWGIGSFIFTQRGIIYWDYILNEEDSFGPFMCIGFAISSSLFFAINKKQNKDKFYFVAMLLSTIGVITSFARGTFLSFIAIGLFNLKKSGNFLKSFLIALLLLLLVVVAANIFFKNNEFWKEMSTISEGTSSGTGRDRAVLWSIAWEEFKANPIFGVGPHNFGVVAGDYLHLVPDRRYYRKENIWGRALHNGFYQILCESGIFGVTLFALILLDFWRKNNIPQSHYNNTLYPEGSSLINFSEPIKAGMLAFLMNAFFYDIIYYNWFFYLLILGRLNHNLYIQTSEKHA